MGQLRMVHLEWDRAHEEFDAIIQTESDEGMIVTRVHDLVPLLGFKWLPSDEIVSIEPLADDSAPVRLAARRSTRAASLEPGLTHLPTLLGRLDASGELVGLFRAATGSGELLVGRISRVDELLLVLDLASPEGEWDDEQQEYELDDVISVEWRTEYLLALSDLLPTK